MESLIAYHEERCGEMAAHERLRPQILELCRDVIARTSCPGFVFEVQDLPQSSVCMVVASQCDPTWRRAVQVAKVPTARLLVLRLRQAVRQLGTDMAVSGFSVQGGIA